MKELWIEKNNKIKHICVADNFDTSKYKIVDEPVIIGDVKKEEVKESLTAEAERIIDLEEEAINNVKAGLVDLDILSIRSLRAIVTNQATQDDYDKLNEFEKQAKGYRKELEKLEKAKQKKLEKDLKVRVDE